MGCHRPWTKMIKPTKKVPPLSSLDKNGTIHIKLVTAKEQASRSLSPLFFHRIKASNSVSDYVASISSVLSNSTISISSKSTKPLLIHDTVPSALDTTCRDSVVFKSCSFTLFFQVMSVFK